MKLVGHAAELRIRWTTGEWVKGKRKRVQGKLVCPSCGKPSAVGPQRSPISEEAALAIKGPGARVSRSGWSVALASQGLLYWACESCLENGRAIRAKPWLQEYCCDLPRLAYYDLTRRCRSCGADFTFSKREQQRWFEEFKLTPSAEPVECRACRAAGRAAAEANTELAAQLKTLNPKSADSLAGIAMLYLQLGRARKAAEYLRRAKNVCADSGKVAQIVDEIRRVESQWPVV